MSDFTFKKLRDYFQNVHTVIIDEISMVSSDIFSFINRRLGEIKSSDLPFVGLNVIVIGDFFQLRPVQGSFFFFTNNILRDLFHPLFLNENMRQHEDGDFYSLPNRVRYEIITQSNEQLLKTRLLQCNQKDVLHIFPTMKKVDEHNTKRLSELSETVIEINAFHDYPQEDQSPLAEVKENFINLHRRLTGGVDTVLGLCIEARVMLIRNIQTETGLVIGVNGTIVDIGPISPELSNHLFFCKI